MCDPITIAGIALTAGSTFANSAAASKAAGARDDVLAAERIRQRQYDAEAQGLNTQSQDRYQDFEGQQDAKANELTEYFSEAPAGAANLSAGSALPSNASGIAVREMAKQSGKASDFTNRQAGALGQLRSFGDLLGDTSRMQARDASLISQIGGFKRGSSNVVPLELDAASQKGAGLKTFGDLLGGAGSMATGYGLTKGPAAAASVGSLGVPMPMPRPVSLFNTSRMLG